MNDDFRRLTGAGAPRSPEQGPFGRVLTWLAGGVLLVAAATASVLVFSVLLVVALVVGGYLWWRTRDLRRQVREAMAQQMDQPPGARPGPFGTTGSAAGGGRVIEGEVVRAEREPPA